MSMDAVRARIRDVNDFPKPGIVFKDITPVLSDPATFKTVIDTLAAQWKDARISKVIGIESRGFLFAAPLAYVLGAGLTIARKPGKLPWNVIRETYALEYGENSLELHVDAIGPGERVLVMDDVLATGGTADAVGRLVARQGAELVAFSFLVELSFLHGARRLGPNRVHALITY